MKRVEKEVLTFYNLLVAGILALIGFSCVKPGQMEYGTPSATFIVKGKVYSKETNASIRDVKVVAKTNAWRADSSTTDGSGNYSVKIRSFPTDQQFALEFRDIDGAANGAYEDLDTTVTFKNPHFTKGDKHWYSGETSQELDVKLNPKK